MSQKIIDINVKDQFGHTALIRATKNEHKETVDYLIKAEAEVNIQDNNGMTPLHWAAFISSDKIAQIFIDSGKCDLSLRTKKY